EIRRYDVLEISLTNAASRAEGVAQLNGLIFRELERTEDDRSHASSFDNAPDIIWSAESPIRAVPGQHGRSFCVLEARGHKVLDRDTREWTRRAVDHPHEEAHRFPDPYGSLRGGH